jgi:GMP synthase-like glutamine amidotransferase
MTSIRFHRNTAARRAAVLFLVLSLAVLSAPGVDCEEGRSPLPIENSRFEAGPGERMPVHEWTFESVEETVKPETLGSSLAVKPEGWAVVRATGDERGALLEGTTDLARGDLISAPIAVDPFRWVEVTVEYVPEKGDALPFVCLRPRADRALVDLDFLPLGKLGERRTATVRLHTGLSPGPYSLSVSILGSGAVRFLSIEAFEAGDYPRPGKPVMVLDMMHVDKPEDGNFGWKPIQKLVTVFGFPSVEFVHYSEADGETIAAVDPALIILSPKSEELDMARAQEILGAVQASLDHGVPVVGICLGHQALAMTQGARLSRKYEEGPDGERTLLSEWGPTMIEAVKQDPLFAGLPRYPRMCLSESHFSMVDTEFTGAELLASTELCETQIFKYRDKPWYTFQAHIERCWDYSCPESCLLWKNMLRYFFLAP